MNDHDSLELELAALRPRGPSAALKKRIADRLAQDAPQRSESQSNSQWRMAAIVGWLLAASLASVMVWRGGPAAVRVESVGPQLDPALAAAFRESSPSIWAYGRAMRRSPEALDELLDRHAMHTLEAKQGSGPNLLMANAHFEIDTL